MSGAHDECSSSAWPVMPQEATPKQAFSAAERMSASTLSGHRLLLRNGHLQESGRNFRAVRAGPIMLFKKLGQLGLELLGPSVV